MQTHQINMIFFVLTLYVRLLYMRACALAKPKKKKNENEMIENRTNITKIKEVADLRRQIAIEQAAKQKKAKVTDSDVPTEFECCYCTTKVCVPYSRARSYSISLPLPVHVCPNCLVFV